MSTFSPISPKGDQDDMKGIHESDEYFIQLDYIKE